MRKHLTAVLLSSGAAALALGIGATAAMATTATTWTLTPGGVVSGSAGVTKLLDTTTHQTLTCKSSATKATLKHGSGQTNPIGSITSVTFSSCTGPGGLAFTVATSASTTTPWHLTGNTFSGGVTHGKITGIKASLSGSGCSATVAGTTATSTGTVTGTYTNSTGILKVSGGNLHVWNVSGCLGLINSGDGTTFTGSYAITPKQTITSP
jgi:hypothetical protein